MYKIILRSKTSEYLISQGCSEIVEILVSRENDKLKAVSSAQMMNKHIRKFHQERIGKEYYYVKKE